MKLVLIGHRGAGKTTLGQALAAELGLFLRDSDAELAKRYGYATPAELGHALGEAAFRDAEAAWLAAVTTPLAPSSLIVLGAGAIEHPRVRQLLQHCHTLALWLPEILQQQRWQEKGIPWICPANDSESQLDQVAKTWKRRVELRTAAYRECATQQVLLNGELTQDLPVLIQMVRDGLLARHEVRHGV